MDLCDTFDRISSRIIQRNLTVPKSTNFIYIENLTKQIIILYVKITYVSLIIVPVEPGLHKVCLCSQIAKSYIKRSRLNLTVSYDCRRYNAKVENRLENEAKILFIRIKPFNEPDILFGQNPQYNPLPITLENRNKFARQKFIRLCGRTQKCP